MLYFLTHGVANLSLRPLARAAGTSARMLVHHFGSKEKLIVAVMSELHSRLQLVFDKLAKSSRKNRANDLMLLFWQSITRGENLRYFRLLFEVQILAIQNPRRYKRYLSDASNSWLRLITTEFGQSKTRAAMATLSTAVIDGLMLELLSTGDVRRTSQALQLFTARCHGKTPHSPARKKRVGKK